MRRSECSTRWGVAKDDISSRHNLVLFAAVDVQQHDACLWFLQLILDAQCQATRDAQIQEKKQIQAELTEEEKRLDAVMETERRRALEADKKTDELCKEQRMK